MDFPVLSFDQDLSSCLTKEMTEETPVMNFYDFAEVDKNPLSAICESSSDFSALRGLPDISNLDSGVEELSVDLQELIDRTSREDAALSSQLFPDLPDTPTCLPAVDCHSDDTDAIPDSDRQETDAEKIQEVSFLPTDFLGNENLSVFPLVMPIRLAEATNEFIVIEPYDFELAATPTPINDEVLIDPTPSSSTAAPPEGALIDNQGTTTLKSKPPSNGKNRRKPYEKGSTEYVEKRERNNVAVRKSRDKAKLRQTETNNKVKELTEENQVLQKKVDLLTKELSVIKGLFANVGVSFPAQFKNLFE